MYVKVIITPILIKNIKIYECFESNLEKINGIIIKKLYQKLEIINKASNSTDFYKSIFKDQHDDIFKSGSKKLNKLFNENKSNTKNSMIFRPTFGGKKIFEKSFFNNQAIKSH